ncbi:hypothetical protein BLNAU_5260 [Blattamonas nauphoetae]|uniref:Uncharacterized protein n=1 Tax=Blattamonas nauphoetae TaxID=2049346 RepID=A0ABQ9Y7N7_9EUKA|nr:hypothetical protein BLNAU_5260 [Blattamonas nauphoetae]
MEQFQFSRPSTWTDQLRSELIESYRAFYTHTKEYVVHLSLHPFALDDIESDRILDFLDKSYLRDYGNRLNKAHQEEVREAMDASALSSSSPPFILTSQLVCRLTNDEIIDIVDRIVALLDSDSPFDDDTILRICAFHKLQLSRVYLPDLFRKAGRSTEQYLHTFEFLLSLPIDYLDRSPINHLLSTGWIDKPSSDEWDDVDLRTVGIVKRLISQNHFSVASNLNKLNKLLRYFVFGIMPQIHHSAARLCQPQFERLFAPSVDILGPFFIQPHTLDGEEGGHANVFEPPHTFNQGQRDVRTDLFMDVCKLCTQRTIARCLNRTGFFSRFVTALFDLNFEACAFIFKMIVDRQTYPEIDVDDRNTIRRTIPNLLEEGWQDALECVYVKKAVVTRGPQFGSSQMMLFLGANMKWWAG